MGIATHLVAGALGQFHGGECCGDALLGQPARPTKHAQVVVATQVRVKSRSLDHRSHAGQSGPGMRGDIVAEYGRLPGGWLHKTEQHRDGGGFSGPIRPQKTEDFAGRHLETEGVHSDPFAVALGEAVGVNGERA